MSICMCMYVHLVFVMVVCTLHGAVCEYMYVYVCMYCVCDGRVHTQWSRM